MFLAGDSLCGLGLGYCEGGDGWQGHPEVSFSAFSIQLNPSLSLTCRSGQPSALVFHPLQYCFMDCEEPVWGTEVLSGHHGGGRDPEALSQANGDGTFQLAKPGCRMHLLSAWRTAVRMLVGQDSLWTKVAARSCFACL